MSGASLNSGAKYKKSPLRLNFPNIDLLNVSNEGNESTSKAPTVQRKLQVPKMNSEKRTMMVVPSNSELSQRNRVRLTKMLQETLNKFQKRKAVQQSQNKGINKESKKEGSQLKSAFAVQSLLHNQKNTISKPQQMSNFQNQSFKSHFRRTSQQLAYGFNSSKPYRTDSRSKVFNNKNITRNYTPKKKTNREITNRTVSNFTNFTPSKFTQTQTQKQSTEPPFHSKKASSSEQKLSSFLALKKKMQKNLSLSYKKLNVPQQRVYPQKSSQGRALYKKRTKNYSAYPTNSIYRGVSSKKSDQAYPGLTHRKHSKSIQPTIGGSQRKNNLTQGNNSKNYSRTYKNNNQVLNRGRFLSPDYSQHRKKSKVVDNPLTIAYAQKFE